ncbi:hypothetical protein [Ktedonospora formicarum]|uniref:Uncharacterized protein n=1 Tax=Ktedonospora formicarum TaxID=2778364 RepID=A0A8J3I684_9CHLR|nr:hypothetical protein [Ktedonospora formicarum]GHO49401.1 hypothetical protein KSX_75640 [Ktedonospora formicarum]
MGGVLVIGDRWDRNLQRDYDITEEMTKEFFITKFSACVIGKADLKEEIAPFLRKWNWSGSVDGFLHYWFCGSRILNEP